MDRLLDRTYGERPRVSKIAQVPRSDLLVDLREHRNNCTRALGFHLKFLNSLRRTDRRRVEGSRPLAQLGMRASERLCLARMSLPDRGHNVVNVWYL